MKLYHYVIMFVIVAITIIVTIDIKTNNLKAVIDNINQIDNNLDTAIDDAVTKLAEVDGNNNIIINKEAAINSFFLSLYTTFGVISDKDSQTKFNQYIPVVAITMEDGFYILYSDEYKDSNGYSCITKRWSEKIPYFYEDDDFIYGFTLGDIVTLYDKNNLLSGEDTQRLYRCDYHEIQTGYEFSAFRLTKPNSILLNDELFQEVRKNTIIQCIEDNMAYYTSRHNRIAKQFGITYNFSLPAIKNEEWAPFLDEVSMYVVFQGYPYGHQRGETYNRIASAGAKVSKKQAYYLEQKSWYLVYHRESCPELQGGGTLFMDEPLYDIQSCCKRGAYACPLCNQNNGANAPDYTP